MKTYLSDGFPEVQVRLKKCNRPESISQLLTIPSSTLTSPILKPLICNAIEEQAAIRDESANKFHKVRDSDLICLSSSEDDSETSSSKFFNSEETLDNNEIQNITAQPPLYQKLDLYKNECDLEGEVDIQIKQQNCQNGNLIDTVYKDQKTLIKRSNNFHKRLVKLKGGKINVYHATNLSDSPSNLYKCFKKTSSYPLLTIYCARVLSLEAHNSSHQGKYNLVLTTKPPENIVATISLPSTQVRDEWMLAITQMVKQFHVISRALQAPSLGIQQIGYIYLKDTLIGEWSLGVACLTRDRRFWYWSVRDDITRSRDLRSALRINLKKCSNLEKSCSETSSIFLNLDGDAEATASAGMTPSAYLVIDFPTLSHPRERYLTPHLYVCCSDADAQTAHWFDALSASVYLNGPCLNEQRLHVLPLANSNDEKETIAGQHDSSDPVISDAALIYDRCVPLVVEKLINFINDYGIETRGIYRLNGSQAKIENLLKAMCLNNSTTIQQLVPNTEIVLTRERYSEHDAANALKRYLRQLPETLIPENLLERLKSVRFSTDPPALKATAYADALKTGLPPINYATLKRLLGHLHAVTKAEAVNHMNAQNLGSVFGPNLMAPRNDKCPEFEDYTDTSWYILVVSELITEYPSIFNVTSSEDEVEKKIKEGLHKMSLAKSASSSRAGEFMIAIYFDKPFEFLSPPQTSPNNYGCSTKEENCFFTKISSTVTAEELKVRALTHFMPQTVVQHPSIPFIDAHSEHDTLSGSHNHESPDKSEFKAKLNSLLKSQFCKIKTEDLGLTCDTISIGDWCLMECVKGGQLKRPLAPLELILSEVVLGWTTKFSAASTLQASSEASENAPKSLGRMLLPKIKAHGRSLMTDRGSTNTGKKKFSFGSSSSVKKIFPKEQPDSGDGIIVMSKSLFSEDLKAEHGFVDVEGPLKISSSCSDIATPNELNESVNIGADENISGELVVIKLVKDPWKPAINRMALIPFSVCAELRMSCSCPDKKKPHKPYKKYCFEFSRSTLSYYKSAKSGSNAIGEFSIEDMSIYQGIEAERDPPNEKLGFTFFYYTSSKTAPIDQIPSYAVVCNTKEEYELWINVLFQAKYYENSLPN